MENIKTFLVLGLVSLAILVGGAFLVGKSQSPELKQSANAKLKLLTETTHDWGQIDINGENAEKIFIVENSGEGDLEVTGFQTSCMCTEVLVTINGQDSPIFGMHTQSNWKGVVAPGETAEVKVVFDPDFHGPQGVGPITRLVSFNSNDPENKVVEFTLTANVVAEKN